MSSLCNYSFESKLLTAPTWNVAGPIVAHRPHCVCGTNDMTTGQDHLIEDVGREAVGCRSPLLGRTEPTGAVPDPRLAAWVAYTGKGPALATNAQATRTRGRMGNVLLWCPPGVDLDLYVSALREAGFDATAVTTAAAATRWLANAGTGDLVVMDLLPAPDDAWAFAGDCAASDIPVVILTPLIRPDRANRHKARALGCAAFVAKPCSVRQLVRVAFRVRHGERGLEISTYSENGL